MDTAPLPAADQSQRTGRNVQRVTAPRSGRRPLASNPTPRTTSLARAADPARATRCDADPRFARVLVIKPKRRVTGVVAAVGHPRPDEARPRPSLPEETHV